VAAVAAVAAETDRNARRVEPVRAAGGSVFVM
jgi:hypothetical protein